MSVYKIYYLSNLNGSDIFYVGITRLDLKRRLKGHRAESRSGVSSNRLKQNKVKRLSYSLVINEIESVDNKKDAIFLESYWIDQFTVWGFKLFNSTRGRDKKINKLNNKYTSVKIRKSLVNDICFYKNDRNVSVRKFIETAVVKQLKIKK